MQTYEVYCRPIGRPDLPAAMVFTLDGTDYGAVWRAAAQRCFEGGSVQARQGGAVWLNPRSWTVCRLGVCVPAEEAPENDDEDAAGWPRPDPAFASPATRDQAIASAYAGRRYENLPIRRGRTVLAFAGNSRPVALRLV